MNHRANEYALTRKQWRAHFQAGCAALGLEAISAKHRRNKQTNRQTDRPVKQIDNDKILYRTAWLHCALSLAAQCIVIGPVCVFATGWRRAFVCWWVCYHDNSKFRASILTKLGLYVKVVTISSWLNFGRPAPPGRGSVAGRKIFAPPYYSQRAVFASL